MGSIVALAGRPATLKWFYTLSGDLRSPFLLFF